MLGIGVFYIVSVGLMIAGLETGAFPEEWRGGLYLIWSLFGLGLAAYGLRMRGSGG